MIDITFWVLQNFKADLKNPFGKSKDFYMLEQSTEISSDKDSSDGNLTFNAAGFLAGITKSLPMLIAGIPFGLVFGVMARQTDLSIGETALMSGMVFAGTAQLVALSLWHAPLPVLSIVLTTFLVNLRYILMSASLRPYFEKLSVWQSYGSMLVLSDGGWALQLQEFSEGRRNGAFLLGNGIAQYFEWVSSSVLGFWLGAAIREPEKWGLDFVVPASFLALLVGMWRGKSNILPWTVAIIASLISSKLLAGNWFILIGGLAGSLTGAFLNGEAKNE